MDTTDAVTYQRLERIALVKLSRPESRNSLSSEVLNALLSTLSRAASENMGAFVLTGSGRSFCAGGDLASAGAAIATNVDRDLGRMIDELHAVVKGLRRLPMPVVVAINGSAIGAGISLAMAGDVRIMARSASFVTGYLAVGASPDGGASYHLAKALGASQALSSLLLNRRFPAEQLRDRGLVDDVVEDSDVCDAGLAAARGLMSISVPALLATRELVFSASGNSLEEHLDDEKRHFIAVAKTEGFREGVAPFTRQPAATPVKV